MSRRRVPVGYRFVATLVLLCQTVGRWRVRATGAEHVPDEGGAVVVWNHHSHIDFAIIAVHLLRSRRRWLRFLAKRELWSSRTLGWVPRLARCVPVDRGSSTGRIEAFTDALEALRGGDLVMVAPEGTISESFEVLPLRTGAIRMAQEAGVPILPVISWGAHRFVTTGHPASLRRAFGVPVDIRYGEPFEVASDADPAATAVQLQQRMQALLDEVWAGYPDGHPEGAWWVPARLGGGAPTHDEVLGRFRPGQALTDDAESRRKRPRRDSA